MSMATSVAATTLHQSALTSLLHLRRTSLPHLRHMAASQEDLIQVSLNILTMASQRVLDILTALTEASLTVASLMAASH